MGADPDQVAVPFDENIFRGSAPPAFVVVDLAVARRHELGDFLRLGGIGDVEHADAGVEPGDRHDIGLGCAGREPALRVVRAKTAAREAEVRVRSVRQALRGEGRSR